MKFGDVENQPKNTLFFPQFEKTFRSEQRYKLTGLDITIAQPLSEEIVDQIWFSSLIPSFPSFMYWNWPITV